MNQIEIKQIYPAAGQVSAPIPIKNVKATKHDGIYTGKAELDNSENGSKLVIYQYQDDIRAISAYCPHQGYDISKEQPRIDGNIYCSLHKRPICIYSEYNQAYKVKRDGEQFILVP